MVMHHSVLQDFCAEVLAAAGLTLGGQALAHCIAGMGNTYAMSEAQAGSRLCMSHPFKACLKVEPGLCISVMSARDVQCVNQSALLYLAAHGSLCCSEIRCFGARCSLSSCWVYSMFVTNRSIFGI